MKQLLQLIQSKLNFVQKLVDELAATANDVAPPVSSHLIHSWTVDGRHYRIADDASWCTCKGFIYRDTCKHMQQQWLNRPTRG